MDENLILILMSCGVLQKPSENDEYKYELNRLLILFSADTKGEKNKCIVEKCKRPIGIERLNEYISKMLERDLWEIYDELYTLIETMKYFDKK